jgi:hypothetical protein
VNSLREKVPSVRFDLSKTGICGSIPGSDFNDILNHLTACATIGTFCDPQLGCSDRLVAQDLNEERSWQLSQELRLASNLSGPVNFSVGGNYLHYEKGQLKLPYAVGLFRLMMR